MHEKTIIDEQFLHTLTVLYVEDEDIVREEVARFLRRRFSRVDEAANGEEGVELFKKNQYDIIITDIKMPKMDGLQMASTIKDMQDSVPIVIVTAFSDADYLMQAIDLGVDGYVKKPINPELLLAETFKATHQRYQEHEIMKAKNETIHVLTKAIEALSMAIEKRDPYTNGHQHRVAYFAEAIGKRMGLDNDRLLGLRLGASVHDIGKLSLPVELLAMPRPLTDLEFALIKTHAQNGADIVRDIQFPWPIEQMILQHHERIDGSGYPFGLKGNEICLEAKIIAVADVVEAISSHRPYRPSLGLDTAIAEIEQYKGIHFDEIIVDTAISLLKEHGMDIFSKAL